MIPQVADMSPGPDTAAPSSAHATATMRANRGRDTSPEVALRSALHRLGLRFRKDLRIDLPGGRVRPDVVFVRARVAVFVDGCFWHGCPVHGTQPRSNSAFWADKIATNRRRDVDTDRRLGHEGWWVLRFWEHEDMEVCAARVGQVVAERRTRGVRDEAASAARLPPNAIS